MTAAPTTQPVEPAEPLERFALLASWVNQVEASGHSIDKPLLFALVSASVEAPDLQHQHPFAAGGVALVIAKAFAQQQNDQEAERFLTLAQTLLRQAPETNGLTRPGTPNVPGIDTISRALFGQSFYLLLPNDLDETTARIDRGFLPILEDVDLRPESYYNTQNIVAIYPQLRLRDAYMTEREITSSAPFDSGQNGHPKDGTTLTPSLSSIFDRLAAKNELAAKLEQQGVIFRRLPQEVIPGMPYTTADDLEGNPEIGYSRSYIERKVREGEIPGIRIDGKTLLPPESVQQLIERKQASLAGKLHAGGRRPGPLGERPSQHRQPRRS